MPELVFRGARVPGKQRVDGTLSILHEGASWAACSGSRSLRPLPEGMYHCRNFRTRTVNAMVRGGVGFSIDVEPTFTTDRTLLRIHPDGNLPGTEGCIGITDPDVDGCQLALQMLLARRGLVRLQVTWS